MADLTLAQTIARAQQTLRETGRVRPFHRHAIIMGVGDQSDSVVLIESGLMKVILPTSSGPDVITGLYGRGELLGELGVLHLQPRSATVIGHRNGVATYVPAATFRNLAHHNRDVHVLVDFTQRQRLHNADQRQLAVASMDVKARVITQLLDWATSYGDRVQNSLILRGLSHKDLAGAVLASEKHVDAVLASLRAAGLVRTRRLCFELIDPDQLARSVTASTDGLPKNSAHSRKSGRTQSP